MVIQITKNLFYTMRPLYSKDLDCKNMLNLGFYCRVGTFGLNPA